MAFLPQFGKRFEIFSGVKPLDDKVLAIFPALPQFYRKSGFLHPVDLVI
jgi:hypothetical protein